MCPPPPTGPGSRGALSDSAPSPSRRGLVLLLGSALGSTTLGAGVLGCAAERPSIDLPSVDLPGQQNADVDLPAVREAARLTQALVDQIEATTAIHPRLQTPLAAALALHQAHLRAVRDTLPTGVAPSPQVPDDAAGDAGGAGGAGGQGDADGAAGDGQQASDAALREIARRERQTAQRLTALAQQAHSGGLALLLGAMVAGIGQRLAEWPR